MFRLAIIFVIAFINQSFYSLVMIDPINPTAEELRTWAFSTEQYAPVEQDWDIIISDPKLAQVIFDLAADQQCPHRNFFLHCLYILSYQYGHESEIHTLVQKNANNDDILIREWAERSIELFKPGGKFTEKDKPWWKGI